MEFNFHVYAGHTGRAGRSKNPITFYTKDDMSIVNLLDKVYVCTSVGVYNYRMSTNFCDIDASKI